ncbi:MAG: potassium transporter TrkG [Candidatus Omnitrophota bacterium]
MLKRLDYVIGAVALSAFFLLLLELGSFFDRYLHILRLINASILGIFIIDVAFRFAISKDKRAHIKSNFIDLIVFAPLFNFFRGAFDSTASVIMWQVVIVCMLVSRVRKINKFITLLSLRPAQLMVTSFGFVIMAGAILLMLPFAAHTGEKTSLIDAIFTATSATCVTGLIVKDTGTYFSIFGQVVILALIQLGGLGIMTFSVSLGILMGKKIQMGQQAVMKEVLDQDMLSTVKSFLLFIVKMTLFFELSGAIILFFVWRERFFQGWAETAYHAAFHSISAFCNAGFSTFTDSLVRFSGDIWTNASIALLIIFGGLGFLVIYDIYGKARKTLVERSRETIGLRLQTRTVIGMSLFLILAGAVVIYLSAGEGVFGSLSGKNAPLIAIFQSITTRTAGFNTCQISQLSVSALFCMILLMFIGGSPGSTAGGIKTTTVAVLWAALRDGFRQKENVEMHKRTIPTDVILRALAILLGSALVVVIFVFLLLYFERKAFIDILFEAVSAFGTVGLSRGITSELSAPGKILISLLMFIGRVGPLTIGYAFVRRKAQSHYKYAEERVMIG